MHLADRPLRWSSLNDPPEIIDAGRGLLDWGHRRKVLIYGAGFGREQAPLDDPSWTVWALNLIPPMLRGEVRADVWFDLHQRVAQTPDDLRWIARCPVPIFVPPDLTGAGPMCVRFPLEAVEARFGSYWSCTFAYQIALALLIGATDIGMFGVDLAYGTSRERTVEWACTSWWMGYAEARGVQFHLPTDSRMAAHPYRYGFEYRREIADVDMYLALVRSSDRPDKASVGG